MSLVQMGVSGTVMILFTVGLRALFIRFLPKRTFAFMWYVAAARLLIPFSLPCSFSAYSLLTRMTVSEKIPERASMSPATILFVPDTAVTGGVPTITSAVSPFGMRTAIHLTGVLICFVFYTVTYVKCRMKFSESLPVDNEYVSRWLEEHSLFRRLSVRCSDRISSPLTYGIFRPVILLPSNYGKLDTDDLNFVLTHEYTHVRRFDALFKLVLTAAACVHWYNPLVWVMLMIANRDIEISCDETVLRVLGEREKQAYAITLIRMAERKSGLTPLSSGFGKTPISERIALIMKFRRTTAATVIAAFCLVIGTTAVFATSAESSDRTDASTDRPTPAVSESSPAIDTAGIQTELESSPAVDTAGTQTELESGTEAETTDGETDTPDTQTSAYIAPKDPALTEASDGEKSIHSGSDGKQPLLNNDDHTKQTDSAADPSGTQAREETAPKDHAFTEMPNGEKIITIGPDDVLPYLTDDSYIIWLDFEENGNITAHYLRYTGWYPDGCTGSFKTPLDGDDGGLVFNEILTFKKVPPPDAPIKESFTHKVNVPRGYIRW